MDRRRFLATGSALALSVPFWTTGGARAATAQAASGAAGPGDPALDRLFEAIFQERVRSSPTLATGLGLDKGALASLKSRLDTRPVSQARAEELARNRRFIASLEAVPPTGLSQTAALNREVVLWDLKTGIVGPERFDISNPQTPYVVSQQDGAYFEIPDFLNSSHTIETAADAEAYLSRLSQFATVLGNETVEIGRQAARGFAAPAWSLDLALGQMRKLREVPAEQSGMTTSLAERTAAKGIGGDWARRAAEIVRGQVYPALDLEIAMTAAVRRTTRPGDGIWRVPGGDAIYAAALAEATTTTMSADEIHSVGLQQVAEISAQLDTILKAAGYTRGSVGERLTALNKSPDQLYPNTDAGRTELIADLNKGVVDMAARQPRAFRNPPNDALEIRRVPPEIQDGAPNGYYRQASLDGSRPAIYFINLKSTADWPKYSLPALTYHEGWPGHHLQISLTQQSQSIPMLRRIAYYSAYGEGWALYAEQVADELGAYSGLERAGYLQSFLFRAERLVVDTGLNHKRWSRERATDHMVAATGFSRSRVQREIERYCASPGQACSYKIGHLAWTKARTKAQAALGPRFDLREFHEILREGAMPLTILERRVDERIAASLAQSTTTERG